MSAHSLNISEDLLFERRPARILHTRALSCLERFDQAEIRDLGLQRCLACKTSIPHPIVRDQDVVGGKHFTYNVYSCAWCGWWNIFKFRENPRTYEIYWCERMRPPFDRFQSYKDFNSYEKHPEISFLMRFLASQGEKLGEISWTAFEDLTREYLLDQGMSVADISGIRSSGGDFLCIDTEGKVLVVEAKHWTKKSVDIGTVWKVIGVITSEGFDGGMIVTSHRFSLDAIGLMERGSIGRLTNREECQRVSGIQRRDLIEWLERLQKKEHNDMLSTIDTTIGQDAMMEM